LKKRRELIKQISSLVSSLSVEEKLQFRDEIVKASQISNLLNSLTTEDKLKIRNEILKAEQGIPISVFKADLSGLELVTRYLKEIENKSFKEISKILNRKLSTIYNTYNNSQTKFKGQLDTSDNSVLIPLDAFTNRKYSVLESIVSYLKDKQLSFTQIASLLNRNYSTVKTVYHRFKLKNER